MSRRLLAISVGVGLLVNSAVGISYAAVHTTSHLSSQPTDAASTPAPRPTVNRNVVDAAITDVVTGGRYIGWAYGNASRPSYAIGDIGAAVDKFGTAAVFLREAGLPASATEAARDIEGMSSSLDDIYYCMESRRGAPRRAASCHEVKALFRYSSTLVPALQMLAPYSSSTCIQIMHRLEQALTRPIFGRHAPHLTCRSLQA